jgi:predicted RNA-binding Zn-ribbon protein involved in translation (DUF1610 family)
MSDEGELEGIAAPNCPVDLVPMELEGEADRVRWVCPQCGLVSI